MLTDKLKRVRTYPAAHHTKWEAEFKIHFCTAVTFCKSLLHYFIASLGWRVSHGSAFMRLGEKKRQQISSGRVAWTQPTITPETHGFTHKLSDLAINTDRSETKVFPVTYQQLKQDISTRGTLLATVFLQAGIQKDKGDVLEKP